MYIPYSTQWVCPTCTAAHLLVLLFMLLLHLPPLLLQIVREDKHLIDVHTSHIQTPHNKPPLSWKGTHVYFSETLVLVVAPCPEEPALQLSSWPFAFAASNPSTPSGWWWLPHGDQFSVALATELASLFPPASWAGTRERKGEGRGRGLGRGTQMPVLS